MMTMTMTMMMMMIMMMMMMIMPGGRRLTCPVQQELALVYLCVAGNLGTHTVVNNAGDSYAGPYLHPETVPQQHLAKLSSCSQTAAALLVLW